MASGADIVDGVTAGIGANMIAKNLQRNRVGAAKATAKAVGKKLVAAGPLSIVADLALPEEAGAGSDNIGAGRTPAFQAEVDRQQRLRGAVGAKMEQNKPGKVLP